MSPPPGNQRVNQRGHLAVWWSRNRRKLNPRHALEQRAFLQGVGGSHGCPDDMGVRILQVQGFLQCLELHTEFCLCVFLQETIAFIYEGVYGLSSPRLSLRITQLVTQRHLPKVLGFAAGGDTILRMHKLLETDHKFPCCSCPAGPSSPPGPPARARCWPPSVNLPPPSDQHAHRQTGVRLPVAVVSRVPAPAAT